MGRAKTDDGLPTISYAAMLYTLGDVQVIPQDLDAELRAWLQESHDVVGMQSDRRR